MDSMAWLGFLLAVGGTSVVSGMVGMIGGMVLLSLLGLWFPPSVLIPLHGCLQTLSNGTRVALLWRDVDWGAAGWFAVGATAGGALGVFWLPTLPEALLSWLVGGGCLAGVWIPVFWPSLKRAGRPAPQALTSMGALTTFLSLVTGTTGPLVDAFVLREGSPRRLLGTKAAFQLTNHLFKVAVYVVGGWAMAPWAGVLLAALPVSILGNRLGQALADRVPQRPFLWVLRILVTILAISIVFAGFQHR